MCTLRDVRKKTFEWFGKDVGSIIIEYYRHDFIRNKYERRALFRFLTYDDWETKLHRAPTWFINELLHNTINSWVSTPHRPKWGANRYLMKVFTESNFENLCLLAHVYSWNLKELTTYIAALLGLMTEDEQGYNLRRSQSELCCRKYHQPAGLLLFDFLLGNRQWVDLPGIRKVPAPYPPLLLRD
jgi:hypothetical protein